VQPRALDRLDIEHRLLTASLAPARMPVKW
jgi:hypothetical protein